MPKRSALAPNCFGALTNRALFALTLSPGESRRRSIIHNCARIVHSAFDELTLRQREIVVRCDVETPNAIAQSQRRCMFPSATCFGSAEPR